MLDLHDAEVVDMLQEFDRQRMVRWYSTVLAALAVPAVLVGISVTWIVPLGTVPSRRAQGLVYGGPAIMFVLGMTAILKAVVPPKQKAPSTIG